MAGLRRERQPAAFMFCAELEDWEPIGAQLGRASLCCACTTPSLALMSDYGNEKDHPEDNTSFNPGTELNNTDTTCAFKCLFKQPVVFSQGFSCQIFYR